MKQKFPMYPKPSCEKHLTTWIDDHLWTPVSKVKKKKCNIGNNDDNSNMPQDE